MRLHISVDDALVADLDARVGRRGRSAYIAATVRQALADEGRWDEVEAALGSLEDGGHDWDADPAAWVQEQRRTDGRRVG